MKSLLTAFFESPQGAAYAEAWRATDSELAFIRAEMHAIHEVPAKEHTPAQLARLKELRARSVAMHNLRMELNIKAEPKARAASFSAQA